MNEKIKAVITHKVEQMDVKDLWKNGSALGSLSMPQKQAVQTILTEVMKEMSPHIKGGIVLVIQILVQVLTSHLSGHKGEQK